MSRGSYQRRVFITVLQHNDGFSWQDKYMHLFTGDDPGHFMKKMIEEKHNCLNRTKKAANKPGFSRRKAQCIEEEHDYGEDAVNAIEDPVNQAYDYSTIESKYELSEATRELLRSSLSITEMEGIAMGRILTKYVPEVISCRDSSKLKKCDMILQATNTWNYLKSNRAIVGLILRSLNDQTDSQMGECRMFVDTCHQYLCCVVDGNFNKVSI
nr:uncharacterized protein LOC109417398 [Aedes albopictus]